MKFDTDNIIARMDELRGEPMIEIDHALAKLMDKHEQVYSDVIGKVHHSYHYILIFGEEKFRREVPSPKEKTIAELAAMMYILGLD